MGYLDPKKAAKFCKTSSHIKELTKMKKNKPPSVRRILETHVRSEIKKYKTNR